MGVFPCQVLHKKGGKCPFLTAKIKTLGDVFAKMLKKIKKNHKKIKKVVDTIFPLWYSCIVAFEKVTTLMRENSSITTAYLILELDKYRV